METDGTSPYRWHWRTCGVQNWTARLRNEFVDAKECPVDASICTFEKRRDHWMAGDGHDYGEVGKRLLVSICVVIRPDAGESRVPKLASMSAKARRNVSVWM